MAALEDYGMISRLFIRTALVALVAAPTVSAQAQMLYQTGFEAPTYSTTATGGSYTNPYTGASFSAATGSIIHAQQGWGYVLEAGGTNAQSGARIERVINSAIIQSSVARSGAQALQIDGSIANQNSFGVYQPVGVSTTNSILDVTFDMLVSNPAAQAGQWGVQVVDSAFRNIAAVGFVQGILVAGTGTTAYGTTPPLTGIGYNNWANYKLSINFFTKTMSIALNGLPVSSMQNLPLRSDISFTATTGAIALGGQVPLGAPYTTVPERAFFDNVTASTAPEPGTFALLSLGGTLVILRRRRTR
jgi:hypothetical protein